MAYPTHLVEYLGGRVWASGAFVGIVPSLNKFKQELFPLLDIAWQVADMEKWDLLL